MQAHDRKTAIYCRVASADQLSLEAQKDRLCGYAAENGYDNLDFYMDNGYSGLNYDRPAFSRLEADIQAGLIEAVIIRDVTRIGRNVFDTVQWIERLRMKGIALISADLSVGENYLHNAGCFRNGIKERD